MSGGTLVWLTDNELEDLLGHLRADDPLYKKLEAVREEIACRVPRSSR
jgi:hypothetical protein